MSIEMLRTIERLHGIVAWTATAVLAALLWIVWRADSKGRLQTSLGTAAALLLTSAGALGLLLEESYRSQIRQRLFLRSQELGWLFERKEHFAFGAILLGWAALAALQAASLLNRRLPRVVENDALARKLGQSANVAWTASLALALAASVASAIVARYISF